MPQGLLFGAALPPSPLVVILQWRRGRVIGYCPALALRASYASWAVALECVLHPLNEDVVLRVRVPTRRARPVYREQLALPLETI